MGSVVSTMFCKAKSAKKQTFFCAAILDHFQTKMFKSETTSFHYFSPKDSESLKILDIRLWEVGAKRHLNVTSKVNRRTNRRLNRQTFRLIESSGAEGRCFENESYSWFNKIVLLLIVKCFLLNIYLFVLKVCLTSVC